MLWDVVRGDTDGDVIDTIEASDEDAAWLIAKNKHDAGWQDRTEEEAREGGYDTYNYIYVRESRDSYDPGWRERAELEYQNLKSVPIVIREFDSTEELLRELFREIERRKSNQNMAMFKTGPDYESYLPEKIELLEYIDTPSLKIGFRLSNRLVSKVWNKASPPTDFVISVVTVNKESSEMKIWWNQRRAQAINLNFLAQILTSK